MRAAERAQKSMVEEEMEEEEEESMESTFQQEASTCSPDLMSDYSQTELGFDHISVSLALAGLFFHLCIRRYRHHDNHHCEIFLLARERL